MLAPTAYHAPIRNDRGFLLSGDGKTWKAEGAEHLVMVPEFVSRWVDFYQESIFPDPSGNITFALQIAVGAEEQIGWHNLGHFEGKPIADCSGDPYVVRNAEGNGKAVLEYAFLVLFLEDGLSHFVVSRMILRQTTHSTLRFFRSSMEGMRIERPQSIGVAGWPGIKSF